MTTRQPQPGDFFLTTISGWKGVLVRVGQWLNGDGWSRWQHAGIYLGNGEIIEAEPGGARIVPLSNLDGAPVAWSSWPLRDVERELIVVVAREFEGTPYAWAGYLAMALHRFHIPTPGLRRYIASRNSMICSQLVDAAYEFCNVHLFDDRRWPGDVTPADLETVLEGPA